MKALRAFVPMESTSLGLMSGKIAFQPVFPFPRGE